MGMVKDEKIRQGNRGGRLMGSGSVRLWFPREDIVLLHGLDEIEPDRESSNTSLDKKNQIPKLRFAAALGKVADLINDEKLLAPIDSAVTPLAAPDQGIEEIIGPGSCAISVGG